MIGSAGSAGLLVACWLVLAPAGVSLAAGNMATEPDSAIATLSSAGRPELERPVPFDSAGSVIAITPRFVARFGFGASWPVTGDFVEARLYQRSTGGFVLVVERDDGVRERIPLEPEAREALARLIGDSVRRVGGLTTGGERADIVSEPAGGAFARNQTVAAALIWGPSLAALTDEASSGSAVYLATVGTTYFVSTSRARRGTITRAQNTLASDGAFRGAAMGAGLAYVVGGDDASGRAVSVAILAGSLATTALGFSAARSMTDGEASGASWGATYLALLTTGALGIAEAWNDSENRVQVGSVVGATILGYPLGVRWVRRSRYAISEGDIAAIRTASLLGVAAGAALLGDDPDGRATAGALTGGLVVGSFVGARAFARPYNLTGSQALQLSLGALAGGLIGVIPPVLAESDRRQVYLATGVFGAAVGMALTPRLLGLAKVRGPESAAAGETSRGAVDLPHARLTLLPLNLAILVSRHPEPLPLATLYF